MKPPEVIAEHYFTGADGVFGRAMWHEEEGVFVWDDDPLHRLTFCVLVLADGRMVSGESVDGQTHARACAVGRR